jgi:predicted O-linked N-acetylglucosamine transferase (SPINDLY family)
MTPSVRALLQQADTDRKAMNWHAACTGYQRAQQQQPDSAPIAHNLALCQLALNQIDEAITQCRRALKLNPQLWQSALVLAKALIKRNDKPLALLLLQRLHAQLPQSADIRVELATLSLHLLGNAVLARQLVAPLLDSPQHGRDAQITTLVTQLYDRDSGTTAGQVNQAFLDFGAQQLPLADAVHTQVKSIVQASANAAAATVTTTPATGKKRLRVGLMSPQFFASPVYFFGFGALQHLGLAVDLVIFNRGSKRDWASDAFRRIAADWLDVAPLGAEQLAKEIARHNLDALIDLGGWMDPVALSALSTKPAKKLYKWVGGQSVTTGLKSFDGFLTDRYQTPKGSDALYSEPLIRLKAGYVTYTPPPYMPAPQLPVSGDTPAATTLGIIANPGKVSRAFLADLAQRHQCWQNNSNNAVNLCFIDYRYQHQEVRQRVQAAFDGTEIQFVSPASHLAYLTAVSALDATIDTWPYSGGLTTIEALAVGVPSYTHIGELFCERHTHAHCRYAGMDLADFRLDRFNGQPNPGRTGQTLLKPGTPRTNHARLADELLSLLE